MMDTAERAELMSELVCQWPFIGYLRPSASVDKAEKYNIPLLPT